MARDLLGDEPEELTREEALAEAEKLEVSKTEDFDAFWSAQDRQPDTLDNVFGVKVVLPPALPLRFEVEAKRAAASSSEEDTQRMVGLLFGAGALDRWIEAGMDSEQFAVLLMWGTVNTRRPRSLTLAEARTAYRERVAQGKALRPESPTSGPASSATGPRSKRTSSASTGSRKKR